LGLQPPALVGDESVEEILDAIRELDASAIKFAYQNRGRGGDK